MTLCQFTDGTCSVCGAPKLNERQACGTWRPGLGDMVAAGLAAVGITKERVEAAVGGPCGCGERQQLLNEMGRKMGIGGDPDNLPRTDAPGQ